MKDLVIIDIDMTLANQTERLARFSDPISGNIDYELFHTKEAFALDVPMRDARSAIETISKTHHILLLSARPKHSINATNEWLTMHNLISPTQEIRLVDTQEDKLDVILNLLPRIHLVIDDFGYNYQRGEAKIHTHITEELTKSQVPFVVFKNDWQNILDTHFNSNA